MSSTPPAAGMDRTKAFLWISFLLCGASWLFPPALLITAPIFGVAIVVWVIAAMGRAARGQAPPRTHQAPMDQLKPIQGYDPYVM